MWAIIFYQMFELCKKVEVYNIQNNYYYYGFTTSNLKHKQKLALHLLKPAPISSLLPRKYSHHNNKKKGIKLSRTIDPNHLISFQHPQKPTSSVQTPRYHFTQNKESYPNKGQLSRLRTDTEYSGHTLFNREASTPGPKISFESNKKIMRRAQQIQQKFKPNYHSSSISNSLNSNANQVNLLLQKQVTQSETTKNLTDTKPASSKIQSTYTNNLQFSSQYIVSKYEPQQANFIRESFQNSSSKLISISKSVSSAHQTSNEKDPKRLEVESEISKSGREISINLSNIFNKQEALGNDYRKSYRETPPKISIFWQDSDRYTIESRISRQGEMVEDMDAKIEQSIIQEHDAKQNFKILESNQIRKKDYIVSQALENNINMAVSLKQFISSEHNLVIGEMHVYELIEKNLSHSEQYESILQLYQVQRGSDTHILIKQPYEMSLQAKIKQLNPEEGFKLRLRAKQIGAQLLEFLEHFNIFPTRKLTTHEFVFCWGQPKIHDLSFFKISEYRLMGKEEILAGLDI